MPVAGSRQFAEQRLGLFQIGRVEAFGEPAIDWREKVAGFGAATLVAAEPGEARGGAQFPELGFLLLGDAQGFAIQFLGGRWPGLQTRRWRRRSRANSSLKPNSLLAGSLQGISSIRGSATRQRQQKRALEGPYQPIPYASEQGIFCGLAGNLNW